MTTNMGSTAKRDEFSCPCCGAATDSSYCAACDAFECGEQAMGASDACLVTKGVVVTRARHAAHYAYSHPGKGHDLLIVEVESPEQLRPAGLPLSFAYHSGSRINGVQTWRFTRIAPLSPGKCGRCS